MTHVRRLILALCLALVAVPAPAQQGAATGRLSATRAPSGPVLAGTVVTVNATIENAGTNELQNVNFGVPFDAANTQYLSLVSGSVTAWWREQDSSIPGQILSGNSPGDNTVSINFEFIPAGQHMDITFKIQTAARLPAGVEDDTAQLFLSYDLQSIPFYMTIPLVAEPHLTLTKTDFGAAFTTPGPSAVTYNLVPYNDGNQDATGVRLFDTVPANTHFDPTGSAPGWSCSPNNGPGSACTLDVGDLFVQQAQGFAFRLVFDPTTVPAGLESLRNVAQVRDDGMNTSGSDTPKIAFAFENTPIVAAPDLSVTKTDGGASVEPGAAVTYALSYRNAGTQDATGVRLVETVPANTSFVAASSTAGWTCNPTPGAAGATCTLAVGDLAVGNSASATFALRVAAAVGAQVDRITNTVRISDDGAGGADLSPANNTASDSTPVVAAPAFELVKTDHGAVVQPGNLVVYDLTLTNTGNQDAAGVVLEETVPAHTRFASQASDAAWSCTPSAGTAGATCTSAVGALGVGSARTATFALLVDDPLPAGVDQVLNRASVHDDSGPDPDATAQETTPLDATPDLAVAKSDGGVSVAPGDLLTYTLTYRNVGDQGATGVILEDVVPAHTHFVGASSDPAWTCDPAAGGPGASCMLDIGALAAGASGSASFAVRVDPTVPTGVEQLDNTALVVDDATNGQEPNPMDNTASEVTPLLAAPVLGLTKTDGGAAAVPGEVLSYALSWSNSGNQDAAGVTLEETVPAHTSFSVSGSAAGWSCSPAAGPAGATCTLDVGSVAVGASGSTTLAVLVDAPLPAGVDQVVNRATIADDTGSGPDDEARISTPVDASPNLTVTKTDLGATAVPGEELSYTLSWANTGDQDAAGVTLEETVPAYTSFSASGSDAAWSCSPAAGPAGATCTVDIGTVAGGGSGSATFAVLVDSPLPAGVDHLVNRATIADDTGSGPDDETQISTPLDAAPNLSVTKSDRGVNAVPGGELPYTLSWSNTGDQAATGVTLEETVPAHTSFSASGSEAAWSCSPASGPAGATCTLDVGTVAGGGSGSATFAVVVDSPLPAGVDQLVNQATIADDDGSGPDDETQTSTPVDAAPGLIVTKTDRGVDAVPGAELVYVLTWSNTGDQAAAGVTLEETVPTHTSFSAAGSDAAWSCSPAAGPAGATCTLDVGTVAGGGSGSATFAVLVDSPLPAGVDHLVNRATIADDTGPGPDNQTEISTPVDAAPDLVITKSDHDATAHPGQAVLYTITWTNAGDQDATGVQVVEAIPQHTRPEPSSSDAGWTCFTALPDRTPPASSGQHEGLKAERIEEPSALVAPSALGTSSCSLSIGALAAGASGTAQLALLVDDPLDSSVQTIHNVVDILDDGIQGPDRNPDDNTASEDTPVVFGPTEPPVHALNVTLRDQLTEDRDDSRSVTTGDVLTYAVRVENLSQETATALTWSLPLPDHTSFQADSISGSTVLSTSIGQDVLRVQLDDLPAGDTTAFVLDVQVGPVPEDLSHLTAQGTISSAGLDPIPSDDPDTLPADDPTLTPLGSSGGGPGTPVDVPAVSALGLTLLSLFLGALAWRALR